MLRKRIIFSLIYSNGFFMQSRNFRLQKVGKIDWLERNYNLPTIAKSLDELIVINTNPSSDSFDNYLNDLSRLVDSVFIPVTGGGGVRSLDDVERLFHCGVDKIVLSTLVFENANIVKDIVEFYGSQSVLVCLDCRKNGDNYDLYIGNGLTKLDMQLNKVIELVESLGVGEIYLNSIDRDGTGFGYDTSLINEIKEQTSLPIIIAGGAGNQAHLKTGLEFDHVSAVATANLFNFVGDGIPSARNKLLENGVNLAKWSI